MDKIVQTKRKIEKEERNITKVKIRTKSKRSERKK